MAGRIESEPIDDWAAMAADYEMLENLKLASKGIGQGFMWVHTKEGVQTWGDIRRRLSEMIISLGDYLKETNRDLPS